MEVRSDTCACILVMFTVFVIRPYNVVEICIFCLFFTFTPFTAFPFFVKEISFFIGIENATGAWKNWPIQWLSRLCQKGFPTRRCTSVLQRPHTWSHRRYSLCWYRSVCIRSRCHKNILATLRNKDRLIYDGDNINIFSMHMCRLG